jgi:hypothetical protein
MDLELNFLVYKIKFCANIGRKHLCFIKWDNSSECDI